MDRRRFLELASCSGIAIAGAPLLGRADAADGLAGSPHAMGADDEDDYEGPLFVMVQANGGWEPTLLCDPKGNLNNSYDDGDIRTAGNIRYAPIPGAAALFDTHFQRTVVINGVDVSTNAHDAGQRHSASGRLGEGYPCLAAMVAGNGAPQRPMSFVSFGQYDRTSGLVAPTRNGNADRLAELSHPDRMSAADPASPTYHGETAHAMIRLARQARTERGLAEQRLPRFRHALATLATARKGSDGLQRLEAALPAPHATESFRQAQLVVAAYKARVGVSGNLFLQGFDTHSDHDAAHTPRLTEMVQLVAFLWEEAERQGVAEKLVVLMCSDFGRTPQYNGNGGKDHWPTTSMIAMGAGVTGNRMVGVTDDGHNVVPLDPSTGVPAADPAAGIRITPAHVHRGLRRALGLGGTAVDEQFPLAVDDEFDPIA
jgi:Protein of unknown function (DUF1501)